MSALLRIGYLSTLYHTSHLLRQMCWVEGSLGVRTRWNLYGTGPEMVGAFELGTLDLGYIGLPPAMIGMARGVPLLCVGGGHVEGTVMTAGSEFRPLEECRDFGAFLRQFTGQRVGVPAAGSIHDVILRSLLRENSISGVDIVNVSWADLIPYLVGKGELAAAVGTPPLAVLCENDCGMRIVVSPDRLWPFNPSYGIVVRRSLLEELPEVVEGFLSLHERACNLIRESPARAAETTVQALPGMSESFVKTVYLLSPRYCASLPDAYVKASLDFFPVMQDLGYVAAEVSPGKVFDRELIDRVHPGGAHY